MNLRRGNLQDFVKDMKSKQLIDSYNGLVKECMAFRSMHRNRASQYFIGLENTNASTSGLAYSSFTHDMDEIIEANKKKLWKNEVKKQAVKGVRSSLLSDHGHRGAMSMLKG